MPGLLPLERKRGLGKNCLDSGSMQCKQGMAKVQAEEGGKAVLSPATGTSCRTYLVHHLFFFGENPRRLSFRVMKGRTWLSGWLAGYSSRSFDWSGGLFLVG